MVESLEFVPPQTPLNYALDRCPLTHEAATHRICIFKLGAVGDVIMATPLLAALRRAYPAAHLTWIVEHTDLDAIECNPYLDEVALWNGNFMRRWHRKPLRIFASLADNQRFIRLMRARKIDILIHLQADIWPIVANAAGAPMRIGVFDPKVPLNSVSRRIPRLYNALFVGDALPEHRTEQCVQGPLETLGIPWRRSDLRMTIGFTAGDDAAAAALLTAEDLAGQRFAVVAPRTNWPSRCWPMERYAALCDLLAEQGIPVVLIGSRKERAALELIVAGTRRPPILAAGVLTFRQIAALIARAALLVSGDTGPMHVAAAVGTPYLALFGPTPVAGRVPIVGYGRTLMHPVPCGPCDREVCPNEGDDHLICLRLITVEEAFAAVLALWTAPRVSAAASRAESL